jgi:hypothetical protein
MGTGGGGAMTRAGGGTGTIGAVCAIAGPAIKADIIAIVRNVFIFFADL